MQSLQEEFKDIEVKYLYTKRFVWHSTMDREIFQGFPLKGRVYRDLYNPKTQNHKLKIEGIVISEEGMQLNGLAIKALQESGSDYDCDFVEVTLDTILDLDILEEDLDSINKWIESGNTDLEKLYEPAPMNEGLKKLKKALHDQSQDEAEALAMGTQTIMNLWLANPDKFNVIMGLIEFLTESDLNSLSDPAFYIRLHPVDGKGVNITQALRAIDIYNSDDRRRNQDIRDLYAAMEALTTELERKFVNNLID